MRRIAWILILLLGLSGLSLGATPQYLSLAEPIRDFFDQQYLKAYQLVADQRHPTTGVYRDAYVTSGQGDVPSSVAATGVGLIALTIADREGWEDSAEELIVQTLRFMNGLEAGFSPARHGETGFFRHWISPVTGARAWNSEYSTIDTALLVHGALFAAKYFSANTEINQLAQELFNSIVWEAAIHQSQTGTLYMVIDENGKGQAVTRPFNEYVIVADLARLAPENTTAKETWDAVYRPEKLTNLPQVNYFGHTILSDGSLLSSFVPQFVFYLVYDYATSEAYQEFFIQAQQADKYDWNRRPNWPAYLWGHGAGTQTGLGDGYQANAIGRNPYGIVSPYIIAGFLPVYPAGLDDLYQIYQNYLPFDHYENPNDERDVRRFQQAYKYGLARLAPRQWQEGKARWYPDHMSVIDWSSMLYGLTAYKHGMEAFTDYLPRCFEDCPH